MKITPLDIRQQQFNVRFRGFDAEEVDTFLEMIADEYEEVIEENKRLKEEMEKREKDMKLFVENEEKLKKELRSSRHAGEDIAKTAGKEAQKIIEDAELKAREILGNSHVEVDRIKKEIDVLKEQKNQMKAKIKEIIDSYSRLLEKEEKK
jgi:cell division initiation protein